MKKCRDSVMQAIDVVLLTKNSEHILEKCLASIYENVPVKNLVVVDGFSTDGTMEIVNKINRKHGNIKVLKVNGSRAKARGKGMRQVSTDWFMFVDSDVILSRDWLANAEKSIKSDIGAVWGVNVDVIPNVKNQWVLKLQSIIARQCFGLRGGMHDTLIRRETVKGIQIPEQLHTYEDSYIINWIKEKGYKTVVGNDIYCLHYKPPSNWSLDNVTSQAILELKCGLFYSHNFVYALYYPFFMCFWFLQLSLSFRGSLSL